MAGRRRFAWLLFASWCAVGVTVGVLLWRAAMRPVNTFANRLTLRPRSGAYGPIQLSLTLLPSRLSTGDVGLLHINTDRGSAGTGSLMVCVPSLAYVDVGDAATGGHPFAAGVARPPTAATFTTAELSRRVVGVAQPSSPDIAAELDELWSVVRNADDGLRTDLRQFRIADAEPWERPWWFRRRRRASLVAMLVLTWLIVAAAIWRRKAGE
jgi:hypothetical protein